MKPAPGEIIDRYKITGEIGSGGMGSVYSAIDVDLNRVVAVKILHMDSGDLADQKARFRRETKALSGLNHPQVVKVYSVGLWKDSYPYLVMEFLQGESLAGLVARKGTVPEREALSILRDVCQALTAVHSLGIVHRDLKPQNIFLAKVNGTTVVKVLDFGLSVPVARSRDDRLTQTGLLIGSAHYMSPEACSGFPATVQSDIYAVGVILYEMLSGSPPFQSDNFMGVIYKHANTQPEPLSKVRPDTTHVNGFDRLLNRCLAKIPESRYPTAEALIDDIDKLDAIIAGNCHAEYSSIGDTSIGATGGELRNRKNWLLAIVCAMAVAALAMSYKHAPGGDPRMLPLGEISRDSGAIRTLPQLEAALLTLTQKTVVRALSMIDAWSAKHQRENGDSTSETALKLLRAHWLLLSEVQRDRELGEQNCLSLLNQVKGKNDLVELNIRSKLVAFYNKTYNAKKMLDVSEPIFAISQRHINEPKYAQAASGFRLRASAGAWLFPNPADEERERIKLVTSWKRSIVSHADLAVHMEDVGGLIDFYLRNGNYDKAAPWISEDMRLVSEAPSGYAELLSQFKAAALVRQARLLINRGKYAEADSSLSKAGIDTKNASLAVEFDIAKFAVLAKMRRYEEATKHLKRAHSALKASANERYLWSGFYSEAVRTCGGSFLEADLRTL